MTEEDRFIFDLFMELNYAKASNSSYEREMAFTYVYNKLKMKLKEKNIELDEGRPRLLGGGMK